ncbi:NAD(P)-binding protein [Thozetella sp. PMI_491]|nr:NAD(P)-binding protein [Thozetella sp. PMI_491]
MADILVTGGTGQQGSAVIDALLAAKPSSVQIRTLTRNLGSPKAKKLEQLGVKLVKGDLEDRNSLVPALTGCSAAYLVTDFSGPHDVEGEIEQGKRFVDVAKELGVKHLVFSSVGGADAAEEVEHFWSKYKIEQYIHASGISYTIIRPVGFMDLLPEDAMGQFFFLGAMAAVFGNTKQKWIACKDIGIAASNALLTPEAYYDQTFTICGQVATIDEVQSALSLGIGRTVWRAWLPGWLVLLLSPHHYKQMFTWLAKGIQQGSPEETKKIVPNPLDIETWSRERETLRESATAKNL